METKDTLSSCSDSEEQQMQQIEDKAKKSCMVSFQLLHSHLKCLSNNDLKETRTECGFKRAFATLFDQDVETFTGTMFINMDQLEKQVGKEEFQEIGSMAAFKVPEAQFQTLRSRLIKELCIKESMIVGKQWDRSKEQDTSSRSENDAHADDVDIRPIYNEEPMAEVQLIADHNVFATRQQYTEQPEFNNEGEVDQNAEQCHDKCPLPAKLTDNQITEHSYQSLESENICVKKTVAQFQKDFLRMETHCVNFELKYQNKALKEGQHGQFSKVKSNEAKVKYDIDLIETINIKLEHKVAKLLKENETLKKHYKELSNSIKTTRAKTIEHTTSLIAKNDDFKAQLQEKGFAIAALKNELRNLKGNSVNTKFARTSILGKSITTRDVSAFSESRNSSNNMPRFCSNDMVHNHYLDEARKKTQEKGRNSEPSMMPSARLQSTANGSKPKTRIDNHKSRNWPASKTRHMFSIKNTSSVLEKTMIPRSCLRWKQTGRIFKTVGLRWVPTGKIFTSSTTKVDSEPTNGSNEDITKQYESEQTLDVSVELSIHDHNNEPSSSKLVPKVVPPADKTATSL
ncbi:hypothetical protein Tco_0955003 [Tanacetum coccineum]|uniref:Uncharacterized protein n=1 Tax=Tanacetum coccineum TaxID=301880 RepID=A0ABQ5E613_9ASTR